MAKAPSHRMAPLVRVPAQPNDPAELEAMDEAYRRYKQTALGQMGCCLVSEAPLHLLAQYVVELRPDNRQLFLTELTARLPADLLPGLIGALQARLAAPAIPPAPVTETGDLEPRT